MHKSTKDWQRWVMACVGVVFLSVGGYGFAAPAAGSNPEKTFLFSKTYLNIPVKNGAPSRVIDLFIDGQCVRQFDVELAAGEPDFWVYLDVRAFKGQEGTLRVDGADTQADVGLEAMYQEDTFPGCAELYKEKRRPQFHYTSRRGWLNDTNGMVYYEGEYHLFYQHNPYGWKWGNMTWGHAVSADMIHWTELGDALHPDALGTIYSGSAVIDHNTAGFQTGREKTMVAFYTSAGGNNRLSQGQPFTQSMAYSNDRGRTWTKYENNPVIGYIANGTRDPKVFWHQASHQWVMVLWIDGSTVSIFTSTDLKTWQRQGDIDGFFECPELFELPVDGDASNTRWVVYGASGDYKIGQFDGTQFVPESGLVPFQYGNCFYASQTFNDIPVSDGRRIQMAWARDVTMPEMPFNQMILFPVSLMLKTTPDGIRLFVTPIDEIKSLHQQHWQWSQQTVRPGENLLEGVTGELFHIKAKLKPQQARTCTLTIRGVPIVYDVTSQQLTCLGKTAPLAMTDGNISLEILADRMSLEIYADDGRMYMPLGVDLTGNAASLGFSANGGDVQITALDVYRLKSAWF